MKSISPDAQTVTNSFPKKTSLGINLNPNRSHFISELLKHMSFQEAPIIVSHEWKEYKTDHKNAWGLCELSCLSLEPEQPNIVNKVMFLISGINLYDDK